jgi:integrase
MAKRGRRGSGSVFHAKDGYWYASWSRMVAGKRRQVRVRTHDQDSAELELDKLRRAYGAGADPATMTLEVYLEAWLLDHGPSVRASTLKSYRGHVRDHIRPLLGGIVVNRLRPADVRRLINDRLAFGSSPSTVARIIATLRIALNAAVRDRSIPDNAAAGVRLPRVDREPVRPLTATAAQRLLDAIEGDEFEYLYRLLLGSGLRLGEALGLDWADVKDGYVLVRISKTKVRATPISDDAVEALRLQKIRSKRVGDNEPVFLGPRSGERLSGPTVGHALPRLLERAGLPRMTPHALRHGAATLMLSQGVPMKVIQEQLGHRNMSTTANFYAHVVPEARREALANMPKARER